MRLAPSAPQSPLVGTGRRRGEGGGGGGHVDALICSAGVAGLNAMRFVARSMKLRGYDRIVNIASIAGKEGIPTSSAYTASKAAAIGLTKSLGKELAKSGVCINAITPATIETPNARAGLSGAYRLHALEDSDGTIRRRRRGRDLLGATYPLPLWERASIRR
jgi:NAD(P)-dependent dehydrogenase (short-subunit alcohol dehydrogenase family)